MILDLHRQGVSISVIARRVGLDRKTVRRYIARGGLRTGATPKGALVLFKDLQAAYDGWCASRGHIPLSTPKFAEALEELGYTKWKSCGRMRYRNPELIA